MMYYVGFSKHLAQLATVTAMAAGSVVAQTTISLVHVNRIALSPGPGAVAPISPTSGIAYPVAIAAQKTTVLVSESSKAQVLRIDSTAATAAASPGYTAIGRSGAALGQFNDPRGLAFDSAGNFYVADAGNNRIQKFTSAGKALLQFGKPGSGQGQLNHPYGVVVDPTGNIYVADTANHRIQRFTAAGKYVAAWGKQGSAEGEFNFPQGLALDSSGNLYVADFANNRIQKFSSEGKFILAFGSLGSREGQFNSPSAVTVDTRERLWVSDLLNHRIQVFTLTGQTVTIPTITAQDPNAAALSFPRGVALTADGNLWVAHPGMHSVDRFKLAN